MKDLSRSELEFRDKAAIAVLQVLLNRPHTDRLAMEQQAAAYPTETADYYAMTAWEFADALLKGRERE